MWDDIQMVGSIKGYGGLQPSEEGRRGQVGHIDLAASELLAVLGVIGHRTSEDHEAAIQCRKAAVIPLNDVCGRLGVPLCSPLLELSDKNRFMRT